MADMIPIYLVACWIFGGLAGYMIGRLSAMKKVLTKLDAILESLQFLISMKKPESEYYQDRMAKIMSKNHLLLYPFAFVSPHFINERTHDANCELDEVKE